MTNTTIFTLSPRLSIARKLSPAGWAACASLLVTTGCWVPTQTGERIQFDITTLEATVADQARRLDQQSAKIQEQSGNLAEQLTEARKVLAALRDAAQLNNADLSVQIETLLKEMQAFKNTVETTEHRLAKIETALKQESTFAARIDAMEKKLQTKPTTSNNPAKQKKQETVAQATKADPKKKTNPKTKTTDKTASTKAKEKPLGRAELLKQAKAAAKAGETETALSLFRKIIKQWPTVPNVTDEAYFQRGEIYQRRQKFRMALQEYIKVVDRFPKGKRADDAYYNIGICSLAIGNPQDAMIFFKEIIKNHKKSPLLKSAQKRLKEVQGKLAKNSKK